jgi:hypothetical protein
VIRRRREAEAGPAGQHLDRPLPLSEHVEQLQPLRAGQRLADLRELVEQLGLADRVTH